MGTVIIPKDYHSCLSRYETQEAIGAIKNLMQKKLCMALKLKRVTAPLFVDPAMGLNDDWKLNCDILFWHEPLQCALEISSMGIRVDEKSLDEQLKKAGCDERRNLPFHKMLLNGELPLTIGGGIGQSRICMLFLGKVHVGEVQASIWDEETLTACKKAGIEIL